MTEADQPGGDPQAVGGKFPVSADLMAVVSGVFVTFGFMFAVAFLRMFIENWTATAPKIVVAVIPLSDLALVL